MAAYFGPTFFPHLLVILTTLTITSVLSKSPELNTVCYGKSDYHAASQSTVVYDGELNTTINGHSCLQWKVDNPFTSPDKPDFSHVLDESHNYCRGVETVRGRPWCYIDLDSSQFSAKLPTVRRGWDWCNVEHCHFYRTECQSLRDRFDRAESEYKKSLESKKKKSEPIPNNYCRPVCDSNGDFEMEQHCNREFVATEESTGVCIRWDNNAEDADFVYNKVNKTCESYTKCRYDRWLDKGVMCDEFGVLIENPVIVPELRPNVDSAPDRPKLDRSSLIRSSLIVPVKNNNCGDKGESSGSGDGSGDDNDKANCVPVLGEAMDDSNDYNGIDGGFTEGVTDIISVTDNFSYTDKSSYTAKSSFTDMSEFVLSDIDRNEIEDETFLVVTEGY